MSAWMGLHHPERHRVTAIDGYAECNICGTGCAIDGACRCCLAADIAAVEDWIEQQPITQSPQVADADAKIQAVRELCQSARVSISKGCLCYGDECSGTCGRGKPLAWNLNPDDILRILDGDA